MTPHREINCPPTGTSPVRPQGDQLSADREVLLSVDNPHDSPNVAGRPGLVRTPRFDLTAGNPVDEGGASQAPCR